MRKKSFLGFLALLLWAAVSGPLYGQGQVNLSQTRDMSELPFVIVRPNGEIIVAWTEGHFNAYGVLWYRTWTAGQGWSQASIAVQQKYSSAFPQMDIDAEGDVHMAYMDGNASGNREIYYSKYAGGRWSAPEMVFYSPGLNSSWPRIDVEGNRIYVLWCDNYTPPGATRHKLEIVLMEKSDGGTWPGTYQNVSKLPNSVSVHPFFRVKNGNVHAAWMDDNHLLNNWNIYYNSRVNGYWGNSVRLNPGANQYIPAVAIDDMGFVHLIYSNKGNPVWYQKKIGSSWTTPKEISTARTTVQSMLFMKYSHGFLHGVWRQREGNGDFIYYGRGTRDGQWETPLKVSHGGQSEYPGLDIGRDGKIHIVYSDVGVAGNRDIFYVRLDQLTSYPVATFDAAPTQGNAPLQVAFDASSSYDPDGKIDSYAWDFGDGNKATGIQYIHTYTKKGVHTAVLTVTDDENQSSTASREITVGTPPVAEFLADPTAGSSPLKVTFDASGSYDPDGAIVAYQWNFGDGTSGAGKFITHTYTNNAIRIATLTVRDNEGLESSASVEIKIMPGPIARFTCSPKKGQAPLKVTFNASNSKPSDRNNGRVTKYEWDFGDGSRAEGARQTHTFQKSGMFTVTLRITDNQGESDSTEVDIFVYSAPVAKFNCSPMTGVAPLPVRFDASDSRDEDGKILLYKWTFGDGTTGNGKVISHTYTKGGSITIWLTVTDNDGYADAVSKTITVIEKPFPPRNFSVSNLAHEGLFFATYMNVLEWQPNPQNTGKISVVKYLIFKKHKSSSGAFIYQDTVGPDTFRWQDRTINDEVEMKSYIYGIRAVDGSGRESDMRKVDSAQ